MKRVVITIAVLIATSELVFSQVTTARSILDRESPAVVSISSFDDHGDLIGAGTGFIVDPNGVLVTNFHVIEGASNAHIKLKTGEIYDRVWVVDAHPRRDIAILKIQGISLPTVTVGNSDLAGPGDYCVAIGNPKGLEHSVSDGLISGIRIINGNRMFQISAPISPGSSGGPLFDKQGNAIGITTSAIVDEGVQNLSFAVPLNYALSMLEGNQKTPLKTYMAKYCDSENDERTQTTPENRSVKRVGDKANLASLVLSPGWVVSPEPPTNSIMKVENRSSNMQVMYFPATDIESVFQIGEHSVRSTLSSIREGRIIRRDTTDGQEIMAKLYFGYMKGIRLDAFIGATITSKGGLVCMGFTGEDQLDDLNEMYEMCSSLR